MEGRDGEEQFSLVSALEGDSVESAWAFWLRSMMPAVLLVVWKSVFVSKVNRKKCREEAKKCFLLLIHHFVALCGRMDQVCQADQGINQ